MADYKDRCEKPWKAFADTWKLLDEGPRPSKQNVRDFERLMLDVIKGRKNPKALILGCTPEIRDMLARYPCIEVTLADANPEMYEAMTHLMTRKPRNEKFVKTDWLHIPYENYFDVVFADFTKGNLPYDRQPLLYRKLRDALKPSGMLIERIYKVIPGSLDTPSRKIIEKYSRLPPTNKNASDLWSLLIFTARERDGKKSMTTDDALSDMEAGTDLPTIKEYIEILRPLLPPGKHWYYGIPWETDKMPVLQSFSIEKELPDDTIYSKWARIFLLRPRK